MRILGRKMGSARMTENYLEDTLLWCYREGGPGKHTGFGQWLKNGRGSDPVFELHSGSFIKIEDTFEEGTQSYEIKKMLLMEGVFFPADDGFYELKETIYFWYPSTASELVQGYSSNGYKDWFAVESRISLEDLLDQGEVTTNATQSH